MIGNWLGDEPWLKALAFLLLLPLMGLTGYLVAGAVGLVGVFQLDSAGTQAGWWIVAVFLLPGLVLMVVQLVLMNIARASPRGAGITFLVIDLAIAFVTWQLGLLVQPVVLMAVASPVPGAAVLIYTGWRQERWQSRSSV